MSLFPPSPLLFYARKIVFQEKTKQKKKKTFVDRESCRKATQFKKLPDPVVIRKQYEKGEKEAEGEACGGGAEQADGASKPPEPKSGGSGGGEGEGGGTSPSSPDNPRWNTRPRSTGPVSPLSQNPAPTTANYDRHSVAFDRLPMREGQSYQTFTDMNSLYKKKGVTSAAPLVKKAPTMRHAQMPVLEFQNSSNEEIKKEEGRGGGSTFARLFKPNKLYVPEWRANFELRMAEEQKTKEMRKGAVLTLAQKDEIDFSIPRYVFPCLYEDCGGKGTSVGASLQKSTQIFPPPPKAKNPRKCSVGGGGVVGVEFLILIVGYR